MRGLGLGLGRLDAPGEEGRADGGMVVHDDYRLDEETGTWKFRNEITIFGGERLLVLQFIYIPEQHHAVLCWSSHSLQLNDGCLFDLESSDLILERDLSVECWVPISPNLSYLPPWFWANIHARAALEVKTCHMQTPI